MNKSILIGNVGSDPEVRYMPNGNAVANLTLATTRRWKDKETKEKKEITDWHRLVFFGKLAEIVGEYVKKGHKISIIGRNQTRDWTDTNGIKRYVTEVIIDQDGELEMLTPKGTANAAQQSQGSAPAQTPASSPGPNYNEPPMDFDDQPRY